MDIHENVQVVRVACIQYIKQLIHSRIGLFLKSSPFSEDAEILVSLESLWVYTLPCEIVSRDFLSSSSDSNIYPLLQCELRFLENSSVNLVSAFQMPYLISALYLPQFVNLKQSLYFLQVGIKCVLHSSNSS